MKLSRTTYIDDEPFDELDARIKQGPVSVPKVMHSFKPSAASRFERLQLMPPPTETSVVATRALGKEFKTLVKLQGEGKLPFYLDPNTDR